MPRKTRPTLPLLASASCFLVCLFVGGSAAALASGSVRVLPPGALPNDVRLGKLKDFDGYFPFKPSSTPEEWEKRAERVRRQIKVATGLWPMPTKTPAFAVVYGKVDRDDYTVEKVYFESFPGHFVTGSLYRPKGKPGRFPAVLCPHGHWPEGRFNDSGVKKVREQIAEGAERFEVGGRYPLQARSVTLARMGCVVFHYDMLGYADSVQIPLEVAHRIQKQRPQMDTPEDWGFFSTQAELWQQSVMGVQTYNSIRALDWLTSLPDVDPKRVGVTGASGGGTQSFILSALDPRVTVSFPAVMVSTAMQGGCTCENACHLRVGTGNIEFAALTAPRPLGMTAADDWTKDIMTKGYIELRQHYGMMQAGDAVFAKALLQFPHNYNFVSREVMYQWFNKHLKLGLPEPVLEEDYKPLTVAEMSVWDQRYPKPPAGEDYERRLLMWITEDSRKQIAKLAPGHGQADDKFREIVGGAVDILIDRKLPPPGAIEQVRIGSEDRNSYTAYHVLLRNVSEGEELPTVFLQPRKWNRQLVIWVHENGKAGLFNDFGEPIAEVQKLIDAGTAVAAADLLYQGEFLAGGKPRDSLRRVDNPRECLCFTLGYNHSLAAQRAHDILSLISFYKHHAEHKPDSVKLIALGGAAPWAAAALAQAPGAVDAAAIDTAGFRFASLRSIYDVNMIPGIVKYGDVPALLALGAPTRLWLAGEGTKLPNLIAETYAAAGAQKDATAFDGKGEKAAAAVEWLLK